MGADSLVVICDLFPDAWDALEAAHAPFTFNAFASVLGLFLKSQLMLHWSNAATVMGHNRTESGYVYPSTLPGCRGEYMAEPVLAALKKLREGEASGVGGGRGDNSLAACLSMAVAFLSKSRKQDPAFGGRVLVIQACGDHTSGYIPLMNCAFLCKKLRIPVDICVLNPSTPQSSLSFVQQVAELTSGCFVQAKPEQLPSLLPLFVGMFLPGMDTRAAVVRPAAVSVEVRAACFCHRKPVEVAFVCSVCLSVFCERKVVCPTCQAKVRLPAGRGRGGRGGRAGAVAARGGAVTGASAAAMKPAPSTGPS